MDIIKSVMFIYNLYTVFTIIDVDTLTAENIIILKYWTY